MRERKRKRKERKEERKNERTKERKKEMKEERTHGLEGVRGVAGPASETAGRASGRERGGRRRYYLARFGPALPDHVAL